MSLSAAQVDEFEKAIASYFVACIYYDFECCREITCSSMSDVESAIKSQLTSKNDAEVKNGLSNILYWGYSSSGYRDYRVERFRETVTKQAIGNFRLLNTSGLLEISLLKDIGLPGFGGTSFLSKILMFLNPARFCILDLQITKLKSDIKGRSLSLLKSYKTSIPITKANSRLYSQWCEECIQISRTYFKGRYRATDVERGFFQMLQSGKLNEAKKIYQAF